MRIDPYAATSYIVKFKQGTGRHKKDGVKIVVGQVGPTYIVSLPGPNDEVKVASKVLLNCLKKNYNKAEMSKHIASSLAEKLSKDNQSNHQIEHEISKKH